MNLTSTNAKIRVYRNYGQGFKSTMEVPVHFEELIEENLKFSEDLCQKDLDEGILVDFEVSVVLED